MIALPGYQTIAKIYESANSHVYRGIRSQDRQPVILKVLKHDNSTSEELSRYKQEYFLIRGLKINGVIKAYDLQLLKHLLVMILEDFGGDSLQAIVRERQLALSEFLDLAIRITDILGEIHAANIIHKDINPANIVFNPSTGELRIIDFGIATILSRSNTTLKNPAVLEGTLAYMSPEQTGRMNRSLDYRTDFYSLGATFYQLLTNQLPFAATDAMELVHCHIARQPLPPHELNRDIPLGVSDIVMKLLAKTAEDRYKSACGIKADLEFCLTQLQTRGNISEFTLGTQDISDKFQIPQKLYGREREVETLLRAFDRISQGKTEMMLVAGYSGIGKSALVQELYKPITRQRGYFISGKFDQFQRNIPYSAVVSAFGELMRQLLAESQADLNRWRSQILAALGPNGQVIVDVIPEVELIIGPQPPAQELGPTETQNRFNLVFGNFIRVFCQQHHPFVMFLDDLQWADDATLKLIALMMTDTDTHSLLLIVAYRDNEVSPTHPLMMTLEEIEKQGAIVKQINLRPLNLEEITQLIADSLQGDRDLVIALAELIVRKTAGNPFFVNEFLLTLHQENLLTFDLQQRSWQWDIQRIEAVGITDNVVELMISKLQKLPDRTQDVLRWAACVGNQFDLDTLAIVLEKSPAETYEALLPAIQLGLIQPTSELETTDMMEVDAPLLIVNYKFGHDRVQQAAEALIDEDQKKVVHLRIGRLLLANIPSEEREERIFELVDHLNQGLQLIADPAELLELASLNLSAAQKAKDATAYAAAREYAIAGMACLSPNSWIAQYDLTLALYKERAEIEYLNGDFERSQQLINLTKFRVKTALEKAEMYDMLLVQYTLMSEYEAAIQTGRKALKQLGVDLPESDLQKALSQELAQAQENLGEREIASLLDAPEMTGPEQKLIVKLLSNIDPPAYFSNQELYAVIVVKMAEISLKYGHVPESAKAYVTYGLILGSVLGDYRSGYEFGQLAVQLSDKFNNPAQKCSACLVMAGHLNHWVKHIKFAEQIFSDGYQAGLSSGEFRHSGYILDHQLRYLFYQGQNLEQLSKTLPKFLQFNQKTQNQWAIDALLALQLTLWNLSGMTASKLDFHNYEINEVQYLELCQFHNSFAWICTFHIFKSQVLYLYGHFTEALNCALAAEQQISFILGQFQMSEHNFYYSLSLAALYQEASAATQQQYWQKLTVNQQQMQIWADNCPDNFRHKYLLVAAEMARISGGDLETIMYLYDRAIASARENEFIQDEALANELAAKFWLSKDKEEFAQLYMQKAYYGYQVWGALRKVEELQTKYQFLLASKSVYHDIIEEIATEKTYTSSSNCDLLDLATVLKAAQAISGEIVLDKLLSNLMHILMENAGARQGCLLLPRAGKLLIAARATVEPEAVVVQPSASVEEARDLPVTVIHYVERSGEDVVLSNAAVSGQFTNDPYIARRQLKSVLCTPIVKGGKLIAILYLENNLTSGAFTPERLEILRLLSSQAAISLENALLYASVEQKVRDRTQELNEKNQHLSQTLEELKRTEAQLIQKEKMSSLGKMVAGVAHEINNPVGFIYGNLSHAGEYFEDLLDLIQKYQHYYPDPVSEISETIEDIDLEFLVQDLQQLLLSIKVGAERIRDIVRGLRSFVHLDEAERKPVDIHEGLDSTSLMLQCRLREDKHRGEIQVIKQYGKLPKVTCYASELNQVFMHILNNAIDALSEEQKVSGLGDNFLPKITIRTEVTADHWVQIRIADNGPGIPSEVKKKIFDPFFTTKPVGSGTGLGLSESYSIVVNKHGGKLHCISAPGRGAEFVIEIPIQPNTRG